MKRAGAACSIPDRSSPLDADPCNAKEERMTRKEILPSLLKICKEAVPELGNGEIDPNKTYRELGINSLDLMQILTVAMKELKTKIPTAQLSEVTTLNGLADLFVKASG